MIEINNFVQNKVGPPLNIVEWPQIGVALVNEYTKEGLFDMEFPSLFPNGHAVHDQPQQRTIHIDQYALHLMRYHDNRFGSHPRFHYFLYNLIMCHRSHSSVAMFVKKSQENNMPTTIESL
jgi:hypothetical protein